jgi:hypothetical protein
MIIIILYHKTKKMKKTNKKIKFVNVEFNNLREATDKLDKMKIKRVYFD